LKIFKNQYFKCQIQILFIKNITFDITMRLIAFIIAMYISLLTAEPVLSELVTVAHNQTAQCCGESKCDNKQPHKNNDKSEQHKQCNPFQVCSLCCAYFVSEYKVETMLPNEIKLKEIKYIENKNGSFFSSYFQPPEII